MRPTLGGVRGVKTEVGTFFYAGVSYELCKEVRRKEEKMVSFNLKRNILFCILEKKKKKTGGKIVRKRCSELKCFFDKMQRQNVLVVFLMLIFFF